jgi:hypothetical protein
MQLFEHMHGPQFRVVSHALTQKFLHVKHFTLLPAMSFLCTLDAAPPSVLVNVSIQVSAADYSQFQKLENCTQNLVPALKSINSRAKHVAEVEED